MGRAHYRLIGHRPGLGGVASEGQDSVTGARVLGNVFEQGGKRRRELPLLDPEPETLGDDGVAGFVQSGAHRAPSAATVARHRGHVVGSSSIRPDHSMVYAEGERGTRPPPSHPQEGLRGQARARTAVTPTRRWYIEGSPRGPPTHEQHEPRREDQREDNPPEPAGGDPVEED